MTTQQAFKEIEKAARGYANGCELERVQRIDQALKVLRAALAAPPAAASPLKGKLTRAAKPPQGAVFPP